MGDVSIEDMTIVGAFAASVRSSIWLTLELATRELTLPRNDAGRPGFGRIFAVVCDGTPEKIDVSVTHLIEGLGARAIVSSFDSTAEAVALANVQNRALLLRAAPRSIPAALSGISLAPTALRA